MKVFPEAEFTKSELLEISTHLTNAAVKKYLHSLAFNAGKDICISQITEGESAEVYMRRVEFVKGGIGMIETLLSVEDPTPVL